MTRIMRQRVAHIGNEWQEIPDEAVIDVPNYTGPPMLCGCCNPNCPRQRIIVGYSRQPTFDVDLSPAPIEPWLMEQRQTPIRMKRPFPANKPAPNHAYRRACY